MKTRIFSALLVVLFCIHLVAISPAYAGLEGCQSQPKPGDAYDCSLLGPYGPGGLGQGNSCISQCKALRDCLNDGGGLMDVCHNKKKALQDCVKNIVRTKMSMDSEGNCSLTMDWVTTSWSPFGSEVQLSKSVESLGRSGLPIPHLLQLMVEKEVEAEEFGPICMSALDNAPAVPALILQDIFAQVFGVEPASISASTHLYTDLGASWQDLEDVAEFLEEYFPLEIDDSVLSGVQTVGDMMSCADQGVSALLK